MRMRPIALLLSAAFAFGITACFPEYTFDLPEDQGDASSDTGEPSVDGSMSEDGGADSDTGDADTDADADAAPLPPPDPDCADEGADFGCVERPPTGWSGPVTLYNDLYTEDVPACPPLFHATPVFEGHKQATSAPASCSKCSCSSDVKGVKCFLEDEVFHSNADCSGCGIGAARQEVALGCVRLSAATSACGAPFRSIDVRSTTVEGTGSCTPSPQNPTLTPAWSDSARACRAPNSTKGCESGFVCAPKPSDDDYLPGLCIMKIGEGDVECPEGPYTEKHVFYRDAIDERSCTECECGAASAMSCNVSLKTYAQTGCSGEEVTIDLPGCGDFPPAIEGVDEDSGNPVWMKWLRFSAQMTGTCAPSGGQPTGSVQATGLAQTICCMP